MGLMAASSEGGGGGVYCCMMFGVVGVCGLMCTVGSGVI